MASILIIEDGTGIPGANSFITAAECRAYAALRGLAVPDIADPDPLEPLIIKACDYLQSIEEKFKGQRELTDQELSWPRSNVFLFNSKTALVDGTIPKQLKDGQAQLSFDATTTDLQPTGEGREVIEETVDVITTKYQPGSGGTVTPQLNKALSILQPLFDNSSGFALRTRRI